MQMQVSVVIQGFADGQGFKVTEGFVCSSWLFEDQCRDRHFLVVSEPAEWSIVLKLLGNGG